MLKEIKNDLYQIFLKIVRYYYLMSSTNSLGKNYEIFDDKIVVRLSKFKWNLFKCRNTFMYDLNFQFISLSEKLKKDCGLDKPIVYFIENVSFDDYTTIVTGEDKQSIYLKNCKFNEQLDISYVDKVVLEDNTYGEKFLGMNIVANDIDMINSKMDFNKVSSIYLKAKNSLRIMRSNLVADRISLIGDKIITKGKNSFVANKKLSIEDKNMDEFKNVKAPVISYNGSELNNVKQKLDINKDKISLLKARHELVKCLKKYSYQYNEYYEKEILPRFTVDNIHKLLLKKK